jgi:hypothetical protein
MPKHLFIKEAGTSKDGLIAIEKLADACKTSLTASAIRYAQLTEAAVAIVISSGSSVEYCFSSSAMRKITGYLHLKKGTAVPRDSSTWNFNQSTNNVRSENRCDDDTDLMVWFHTDCEIEAREEVVGLGGYGKTLTIITTENLDEDDEEIDSEWEEPKFR